MTRNWDAEWQELSNAQDNAFQEFQRSMTVLTGMFLGRDGPSEEQLEPAKLFVVVATLGCSGPSAIRDK